MPAARKSRDPMRRTERGRKVHDERTSLLGDPSSRQRIASISVQPVKQRTAGRSPPLPAPQMCVLLPHRAACRARVDPRTRKAVMAEQQHLCAPDADAQRPPQPVQHRFPNLPRPRKKRKSGAGEPPANARRWRQTARSRSRPRGRPEGSVQSSPHRTWADVQALRGRGS